MSWNLQLSISYVDLYAWGPDEEVARQKARLSVLSQDDETRYLCVAGNALCDVILLDLRGIQAYLTAGRPAPNIVTFRSKTTGLKVDFPSPEDADAFRGDDGRPMAASTAPAPSLRVLHELGCLNEEDIADAYQRTSDGRELETCPFLLHSEDVDEAKLAYELSLAASSTVFEVHDVAHSEEWLDNATVPELENSASTDADLLEYSIVVGTSTDIEDDWVDDFDFSDDDSDIEEDVWFDAGPCLDYVWFKIDA